MNVKNVLFANFNEDFYFRIETRRIIGCLFALVTERQSAK